MEPLWTITLFAEMTLRRGDGSVNRDAVRRFRSRKAAALLAYLAFYRGRAVSREYLCDQLWPDEPDASVTRNRFRVTLASLRRQLEPPGVAPGAVLENVGNNQVRLRTETVLTDVAAFESAIRSGDQARAAALYRGPLLPTFYEEWILPEQERLAIAFARLERAPLVRELTPSFVLPAPELLPPAAKIVSIPHYLTRFWGREVEREHLAKLFADPQARLITLSGIGGIGKTRFASEVVRDDPTLCAFVPLADIWDACQLSHALRQTLQLPALANVDSLTQVVTHLNQLGKVRIVLDNVEQVAQGTALFVGELLARVPSLFLLITSRRRLDFPGEREVSLAPLPLPSSGSFEHVASAPSVQLFLDRAQAVRPDYQITLRNQAEFSGLCHLLDGIPLALELAAARVGTLTPGQIHAQIAERIETLGKAAQVRGKEERHRSMSAVIEWSYALLPPDLRRFFLSLSVFRGSWDLAAVEAVTGESHVLDYLSRLRGHSLLIPDGGRFRILETLRAWSNEHLCDGPGRTALLSRHADYYRDLGEATVARAGAVGELPLLETLESNEANLRAAFAHALIRDTETAVRLALVLYALGRARGTVSETLHILDQALPLAVSLPPPYSKLYAQILLAAGELTLLARGAPTARPFLRDALPLARFSGDDALTARALRSLADIALFEDDYNAAQSLYQEALALQENVCDERGVAETLNSIALFTLRTSGDFSEATRLTRESGEYFRRVGDTRMLSYNIFNLGELALEQGDSAEAELQFRESLDLAEELRDDWQRLYALFALARTARKRKQERTYRTLMQEVFPLALRIGDRSLLANALREQALLAHTAHRAATLLAAAHVIEEKDDPSTPCDDATRLGLPRATLLAAWNRGTSLTAEAAIRFALSGPLANLM